MLSREEAVCFITKSLLVSSPLEKLSRDRYSFLVELIGAFKKIPLQNLSLLATPPHLRRRYVRVCMAPVWTSGADPGI